MQMEDLHNETSVPVRIPAGPSVLDGDLSLPEGARGIIVFAHGSGSNRLSPRNQYLADVMGRTGFATLLMDLLTEEEEDVDRQTGQLRFDIELLSERLVETIDWLEENGDTELLKIGFFGASTGSSASLAAAAQRPQIIQAIVSRGGRPDMAGGVLSKVRAPTLLIVGGEDRSALDANRSAQSLLHCEKKMEVIAGATHLFEEQGTLEKVARLAARWFDRFLD